MAKAATTQQNKFDTVFRTLDSACTLPFASWCARIEGYDRIRLSVSPIVPSVQLSSVRSDARAAQYACRVDIQ